MPEAEDDFDAAFNEFAEEDQLSEEIENAVEDDLADAEGDESGASPGDDPNAQQDAGSEDEVARLARERDEWRHRYQSDQGRISALQRKLAEVQDTRNPSGTPSAADIAGAMGNEQEWSAFSETYPDIAKAIEGRFAKERQISTTTVHEAVAPLLTSQENQQQIEAARYQEWQYNLLQREHPDYLAIAQTKQFAAWRDAQRPAIQTLFASQDYRDAAEALRLYKRDASAAQEGSAVASIRQQRERRLDHAAAPQTRNTSAGRSPIPADDFDAAFAAFAARKQRA